MKKIVALVIVMVLLSSCVNGKEQQSDAVDTSQTTQTQEITETTSESQSDTIPQTTQEDMVDQAFDDDTQDFIQKIMDEPDYLAEVDCDSLSSTDSKEFCKSEKKKREDAINNAMPVVEEVSEKN